MAVVEEPTFDVSVYALEVPSLDGYKAVDLKLSFTGSSSLDRTSLDDLDLLKAARLGEPVRLIVVAESAGEGFRLARKPNGDGELGFSLSLRVVSVEMAELA